MGAKSERVSCLSSIYTAATLKRSGSIHLGSIFFVPSGVIFLFTAQRWWRRRRRQVQHDNLIFISLSFGCYLCASPEHHRHSLQRKRAMGNLGWSRCTVISCKPNSRPLPQRAQR